MLSYICFEPYVRNFCWPLDDTDLQLQMLISFLSSSFSYYENLSDVPQMFGLVVVDGKRYCAQMLPEEPKETIVVKNWAFKCMKQTDPNANMLINFLRCSLYVWKIWVLESFDGLWFRGGIWIRGWGMQNLRDWAVQERWNYTVLIANNESKCCKWHVLKCTVELLGIFMVFLLFWVGWQWCTRK